MSWREQRSRRAFLGLVGAGAAGVAGCLGRGGSSISVLAAGSLARALEDGVGRGYREETGFALHGEYYGTKALLRMIRDRQKHPDVAIGADAGLLRDHLYPTHATWDVAFATNELGLAYDPTTDLGRRLDAGEPWYEVLADADAGDVAMSDPDLDPLGYRAVLLFELAGDRYDLPGFRDRMLERAYREPDEVQLLAGVETGSRAVAVAYRNMAVDRDLSFETLPAELNFSDPAHADRYASVSYTTDDGHTVRGRPIAYAATVLDGADAPDAGRRFVRFLLDSPGLLENHGLEVPDRFPETHGDPPEALS